MLYMSTFNSAFIMVLDSDVQKAKMWLENAGYKFVYWKDSEKSKRPSFKFAISSKHPTLALSQQNIRSDVAPDSVHVRLSSMANGHIGGALLSASNDNLRARSSSVDGDNFTQFNLDLDEDLK